MTQTALITGASYGIGKQFAYLFAQDGIDLVLVARSLKPLEQLADELQSRYPVKVKVMTKDLTDVHAPSEIEASLQEEKIEVDYLVNNAGYGVYGEFAHTDLKKETGLVELNIRALTIMTKIFVAHMLKRGQGAIMNVSSTAAFQPGPLMSTYYASKAYVLSFTEALECELKGSGITVTAFCPGPTHTEFSARAELGEAKLFQKGVMDVETATRIGYQGFRKGKRIVIPGLFNRLLAQSYRFMPRKAMTRFVYKYKNGQKR